jgi:hypothetical protein
MKRPAPTTRPDHGRGAGPQRLGDQDDGRRTHLLAGPVGNRPNMRRSRLYSGLDIGFLMDVGPKRAIATDGLTLYDSVPRIARKPDHI